MMVMKSSLPGPFLLLLLSSLVSGLASVLVKNFTQIQNHYTWQEAQTFCRSFYTDLAVIYEQSDADILNLQQYNAWFGLHKQLFPDYHWVWPNGQYLYFYPWPANEPSPDDTCAYVSYDDKRFYGTDCGEYYFFICYKFMEGDYRFTFINQSKTWSDAQQYCRKLYDNLAIIKDYDHLNSAVKQQDFPLWTGLYRDGGTWQWSTGLSDYRNWAPNQPGNNGDCVAINSLSKTMITQNCSARYPFICYRDNLLLVKENKSWEEALNYCTTLTSLNNGPYQLVSVQPGEEYNYMLSKIMEADTDEVWTGLHFLATKWLWVNGADMLFSDLPTCPVPGQYCGAFSKNNTGSLETRDCLDKKNFLCYSPP